MPMNISGLPLPAAFRDASPYPSLAAPDTDPEHPVSFSCT